MTDIYKALIACDSEFFNTCYYCEDESNGYDHIPPLKYSNRFIRDVSADYIKVPVCAECITFLKGNKSPYFNEHIEIAKLALAKKYAKALSIYELWNENETKDLDESLSKSIKAGLKLGKEAHCRFKFKGFKYELDGDVFSVEETEPEEIIIFGELFYEFKDALDYASYTYQIPKVTLKELLKESGNNFDKAIKRYQSEVESNSEILKIRKVCFEFSEEHNLSFDLVYKKLIRKMKSNIHIQPDQILEDLLPTFFSEYRDFLFFIIRRKLNSAREYTTDFEQNTSIFELDDLPKRPSVVYKRNWKIINSDYTYYQRLNSDNDYILDSINYISYDMIRKKRKISSRDLNLFLENNDITTAREYESFLLDIDGYDSCVCFPKMAPAFR